MSEAKENDPGSQRLVGVFAVLVVLVICAYLGMETFTAPPPVEVTAAEAIAEIKSEPSSIDEDAPRLDEASPRIQVSEENLATAGLDHRTLAGRVLNPQGEATAYAVVYLFIIEGKGISPEFQINFSVDERGRFTLPIVEQMYDRQLALVVSWSGVRPGTLLFRIERGKTYHDLLLQMEKGLSIEGQVISKGDPLSGVKVGIDLRQLDSGANLYRQSMIWLGDRMERLEVSYPTDSQGRFVLSGLGPYTHRLLINYWEETAGGAVLGFEDQVQAPRSDLLIDLSPAEVEVIVRQDGRPAEGVWVIGSHERGQLEKRYDSQAGLVLVLPPSTQVELSFFHDQCRPLSQRLVSPRRGNRDRIEVDLETVPRPDLHIHLLGAKDRGISQVQARLQSLEKGMDTARLLTRDRDSDRFVWSSVPADPGVYQLEVGGRGGTSSKYLVASSRQVHLTESGPHLVEFAVQIGAIFELMFGKGDQPREVEVWLIDARGERAWEKRLSLSLLANDFYSTALAAQNDLELVMSPGSERSIHVDGTSSGNKRQPREFLPQSLEILPPGRYRLQARAIGGGFKLIDREIEIFGGSKNTESLRFERLGK